MLKVPVDVIKIGAVVPYDCYDAKGILLLKKGSTIQSERMVCMASIDGVFIKNEEVKKAVDLKSQAKKMEIKTTFDLLAQQKDKLKAMFNCIASSETPPPASNFFEHIMAVCLQIQKAVEIDCDAAIGFIHRDPVEVYTVSHPLHKAVLCEIMGARAGLSVEERKILMAAALTANISILRLQEELHSQSDPLTLEQKNEIQKHPEKSVQLLKKFGIGDEEWLQTVLFHHEREDGAGYGLHIGSSIPVMAKIVALTDVYSAMIKPRTYRKSIKAKEALRDIFLSRGSQIDSGLCEMIIKEIGIYPPGTFVLLKNGEIGIVSGRDKLHNKYPEVRRILGFSGCLVEPFVIRHTDEPQYMIQDMVEPPKVQIDWGKIWVKREVT